MRFWRQEDETINVLMWRGFVNAVISQLAIKLRHDCAKCGLRLGQMWVRIPLAGGSL